MADNTIDTLSLEIVSSSSQANKALDNLARKLLNVNKALQSVNTGGLRNYARDMGRVSASIKALNGLKANIPNLSGLSKQLENLGKVDFSALTGAAQPLKDLSAGLRSLSGLENISIPKLEAKNINSVVSAVEKISGADTAKIPIVAVGIEKLANSMTVLQNVGTVDKGINTTINALNRLFSIDMSNFNPDSFSSIATSIGSLANIPDVSSGLNRFMSSLQKLANAGPATAQVASALPALGAALRETVDKMASAGNISDSVNMFTQSIGRLASAGEKTGQTAAGLQNLAEETLKFFQTMTKAPKISQNTIAMTQALARLASDGGKVGTATGTITGAFNKLSSLGTKSANAIKKAAAGITSSFSKIGSASKHLNVASFSLGKLFKAALPLLSIRQLFNWGRQAIDISSDLTEVQNVVDVTFGEMKQKVEDLASISITDFGMSELTAKQISSRFQAMGVSMGFSQEKMSDMSIELTKLAADMASFYNVEQSDMARSLQSVFTGEAEPMRRYGIDLTQTTLQEYALAKGITTKISAMSQAEKTMLRYQYVMENTAAAQGDYVRTADTWHNSVVRLQQSFETLGSIVGGTLINAFKPLVKVLNSVLQKVISFVETVSEAFGAIFGWKIEVSGGGITDDLDYAAGSADDLASGADNAASGLGDATGSAQKLKKALSVLPFDELNQLSSNLSNTGSGSGGGGGAGSGGTGSTGAGAGASANLVETDSIFKKYESEIKNLEQLGEYIGDSLAKAMQDIDWNKVYAGAQNFGTGLADFLNGLISPKLFGETGRLIANSLNTALYALNSFGETFDWSNFGLSIATGLNKFFRNTKISLAADTFDTYVNGIVDSLKISAETAEWDTFGDRIATFLKKALEGIEWEDVYLASNEFGNGIAKFLNNLITPEVFGEIGGTLAGTLNTVISGAYSLIGDIEWKQWGEAIGTSLNTFFSDFNWETAGLTLDSLISGFVEFLKSAAKTGHWNEFGAKVGELLSGINWVGYLYEAAKAIVDILGQLLEGLASTPAGKFAVAIGAALAGFKLFSSCYKFVDGISEILGGDRNTRVLTKTIKDLLTNASEPAVKEATESIGKIGGAASTASGFLGTFKSILSGIVPATVISGIAIGGIELGKFVDYVRGGNGELSEFGGLMDSINTQGVFNDELNTRIFKLKENLENSNATTDEWRQSFINLFRDAGVSAETLDKAYQNMSSTMNVTAGQQELMKGIISGLGSEAELSADRIEESGIRTDSAFQTIKDALLKIQTQGHLTADDVKLFNGQLDAMYNSGGTATESLDELYDWILNVAGGSEEAKGILDGLRGQLETGVSGAASTASTNIGNVVSALFGLSQNSENAEQKGGLLSTMLSGLKDGSWSTQIKMLLLNASTKTLGENAETASGNTSDLGTSISGLNTSGANSKMQDLNKQLSSLSTNSKNAGDNWTKGLVNGITNSVPSLQTGIKSITNTIIDDTQTQLGEHSPSTISYGFGKNWIQGFINGHDSLKNTLLTNIGNLYKSIKDKFNTSKLDFTNIGKSIVSSLKDGLSDYSSVTGAVSLLKENIKKSFNGFSLYKYGQSAARTFASGFQSIHIKTPRMYISSWEYHNVGDGGRIATPRFSVQWLAKGGLATGLTAAMIGEAGKEAVLPLENHRTMSMIADSILSNASGMGMDEEVLTNAVARGVAMAMMNNMQGQSAPEYIQNSIYLDSDVMARAITKAQKKKDYQFNPTPQFG